MALRYLDEQRVFFSLLGLRLSFVCICDRYERKYLETRQWNWNRVVEWSGSAKYLAAPQSPPMDGTSHFRSANTGRRFVRDAG